MDDRSGPSFGDHQQRPGYPSSTSQLGQSQRHQIQSVSYRHSPMSGYSADPSRANGPGPHNGETNQGNANGNGVSSGPGGSSVGDASGRKRKVEGEIMDRPRSAEGQSIGHGHGQGAKRRKESPHALTAAIASHLNPSFGGSTANGFLPPGSVHLPGGHSPGSVLSTSSSPHPYGTPPPPTALPKKKTAKPRDRELERLEREKHEAAGKLKPRRGRPSQAQLEANEEEMRLLREQALASAMGTGPPPSSAGTSNGKGGGAESTAAKAGLPVPRADPAAEAQIRAKLEAHKRKKAEDAARKEEKARNHRESMARMGIEVPPGGGVHGRPPKLLGSGPPPALLGGGPSPYGPYPYPAHQSDFHALAPMPPGGLLGGASLLDPRGQRTNMPPPVGNPNLPLPSHMRPPPGSMPNQRYTPPEMAHRSPHAYHQSTYRGDEGPGSMPPPPPPHPSAPSIKREPSASGDSTTTRPIGPLGGAPALLPPSTPLRPKDAAYEARLRANRAKEPLNNVSGPAPVWASKRKGLTSALEYFQDPIMTLGGSVEVGQAGLARMVLLEGEIGEGYVFWGTGRSLGTAVLPFGHPRRKRIDPQGTDHGNAAEWSGFQDQDPVQPSSPRPTLERALEDAAVAVGLPIDGKAQKDTKGRRVSKKHLAHEAPEIAAMLLAHRARTPIAIGVAEDFKNLPWRLPRPYIVLGWFYITDAWLEPHQAPPKLIDPNKTERWVRWRFRFDWCKHGQLSRPWWGEITTKQPCLFEGSEEQDRATDTMKVSGKDLSPTETLRVPKAGAPLVNGHLDLDPVDWQVCKHCGCASLDVYSQKEYCINEVCPRFFLEKNPEEERISRKIILRALRPCRRISPKDLGLPIRPGPFQGKTNSYQAGSAVTTLEETSQARSSAGRDFWKGWCCSRCGMACERRLWKGWECEGCGSTFEPARKVWTADMLADPNRPVCTGPRIDDGFPRFPASTVETAMIWEDGLRICLHGIDDSTEIHHALGHHGNGFLKAIDHAFEALQAQGEKEVFFRRVVDQGQPSTRVTETGYSPFYTALTGSDATPAMEAIPSYKPKAWTEVPPVCASIMREVNSLAGRMIEGEKEFNALLLVTMPVLLPHAYIPRIKISPQTSMAFLVLGSDAIFSFRKEGNKQKRDRGEVTAFHGDLVLVRTATRSMEVSVKLMGFGFIAIARQVYPRQDTREGDAVAPLITDSSAPPPPPGIEYPLIKIKAGRADAVHLEPEIAVRDQGWNLGGIQLYPSQNTEGDQDMDAGKKPLVIDGADDMGESEVVKDKAGSSSLVAERVTASTSPRPAGAIIGTDADPSGASAVEVTVSATSMVVD